MVHGAAVNVDDGQLGKEEHNLWIRHFDEPLGYFGEKRSVNF